MKKKLRVGTRKSPLALWQTNYVIENIKAKYPDIEFETVAIKTKGDKILDVSLSKVGDKGLFTQELESALFSGEIDFAVHSMKDLPTVMTSGLIIGAMTKRHDPRDVLLSLDNRKLMDLPANSKIGTSSLRRRAQLLHIRPDVKALDIRGNLNTRYEKLKEGKYDAIILAAAGVERLGWGERISERLNIKQFLPAVGQGSIGVQIRANDALVMEIIKATDHEATHACILAERALMSALDGGCQVPIGSIAEIKDGQMHIEGIVASVDGTTLLREKLVGISEDGRELGKKLAENLIDKGANDILNEIRA